MNTISRKVMAFGTFDGLHAGHREFLRQARQCGDYLVVVVAPDAAVQKLKNHLPRLTITERRNRLTIENLADEIVTGDVIQGNWEVIKKHQPHIIALGYDQTALKNELEKVLAALPFPPEFRLMRPHRPEIYHSSLLN